ncbi:MAG TPA: family 20 glycosylhydrolase [Polyangiaceae bacterium]|jgi:hypothetical protein
MRGVLIDASRLVEQHRYYFELVGVLASWGLDTLLFHFSDDHGLSVSLPGFEELAAPHALSALEVRELVAHGQQHGVRIIPELECFGHTRYLAKHPRYGPCFIGDPGSDVIEFSAVDPTSEETKELMRGLLAAVDNCFGSEIIHIGCDEVNLGPFCKQRGIEDSSALWSGYVNGLIGAVQDLGRRPMLWADHLVKDPRIRAAVDKSAIAVDWQYSPDAGDAGLAALKVAGFSDVVVAPAASCWTTRCHGHRDNLDNIAMMTRHAARHGAAGLLNTVWHPYRHLQRAMYHALAFGALQLQSDGELAGTALDVKMAEALFESDDGRVLRLCAELGLVQCAYGHLEAAMGDSVLNQKQRAMAERSVQVGTALLAGTEGVTVPKHQDWWDVMRLSARTAVHCCRLALVPGALRQPEVAREHVALAAELEADWDATRFSDDPAKTTPRWRNEAGQYLLAAMRSLHF